MKPHVRMRPDNVSKTRWYRAHRQALINGEFADDCVHGERLHWCRESECQELYESIVRTYAGLVEASGP